jgi:hypothetical protein
MTHGRKVEVWLNRSERRHPMLSGYVPGDKLEKVYAFDEDYLLAGSDPEILNQVWVIFNQDHPPDYEERSLSVGDVVAIAEIGMKNYWIAYAVESVGFRKIGRKIVLENL